MASFYSLAVLIATLNFIRAACQGSEHLEQFINSYPLDSELSGGQRYPAFKQLRPDGKGSDPNWYLVVHGEKTITENSI